MNFFKRARIRYILIRHPVPHGLWEEVTGPLTVYKGLSAVEKAHLRELTTLFLYEKHFSGAQGLKVTPEMRVTVAAQACLLILALGIDYFDGWREVVIYPGAFRVSRDQMDEQGIVHHEERALSGESWSRGPVILSWEDISQEIYGNHPGRNVVLHEFAHKLDMLNGKANGMPPLHSGMDREKWTNALSQAFDHLQQRLEHHDRVCINPYAATNPAEFFAVISEYFFSAPDILFHNCPDVYHQLRMYYRQEPLLRMKGKRDEERP